MPQILIVQILLKSRTTVVRSLLAKKEACAFLIHEEEPPMCLQKKLSIVRRKVDAEKKEEASVAFTARHTQSAVGDGGSHPPLSPLDLLFRKKSSVGRRRRSCFFFAREASFRLFPPWEKRGNVGEEDGGNRCSMAASFYLL